MPEKAIRRPLPGKAPTVPVEAVAPMFHPVRTRRGFEAVCDQIRQQVERGELRPGDRLPSEKDLAEQFDISRSGVRVDFRAILTPVFHPILTPPFGV